MEQLALYNCLEITPPAVVSFYGAGGKTTLLRNLAAEMVSLGHKALLTTTTKIYPHADLSHIYAADTKKVISALKEHFKQHNLAVLGQRVLTDGKIAGIETEFVAELLDKLNVSIFVEADGARGMPIKGYAEYEPLIPSCSDLIVPVIGADALMTTLTAANVHRLPQLLETIGEEEGGAITENLLARTFSAMIALGSVQAPGASVICVLNKADLLEAPGRPSLEISHLLAGSSAAKRFLITMDGDRNPVKINLCLEGGRPAAAVSCIILAAGLSSRMGQDKLRLKLGDKTVLEQTIDNIVKAGLKEIIVVTRPEINFPILAEKYNCRIIENPHYKSGLSSSLKAGLLAVKNETQGVIFALGDQPLISVDTIKLLVNRYRNNLKLITCPHYRGQRGNPIIFDRRTWPDLLQVSGDQGGRALFHTVAPSEIDQVDTEDPAVVMDLDTPEDYQNLRRQD